MDKIDIAKLQSELLTIETTLKVLLQQIIDIRKKITSGKPQTIKDN